MDIITCWRCEQPGHVAAECARPAAGNRRQLYERVDRYIERWIAKEITTEQKREWITAERNAFEKASAA